MMTDAMYDFEEKFWATTIPINLCKLTPVP